MDIAPRARRALLTAYADTDAAIRAINVVDVDHYLLKPWEPPEEKLYPVVDALIETWRSGRRPLRRGDPKVRRPPLVGRVVRRPRLPGPQLRALPLVQHRGARTAPGCSTAAGATADDVPVLVTPDGTVLQSPVRGRDRRGGRAHHHPTTRLLRPHRDRRRPGRARAARCTGRRRGCGRCSSSGRPPAARPGRARASRTTSASRTGCPAPSSPTAPAGRRRSSAPRCSPRATSSAWRPAARPASCSSATAREIAAHSVVLATGRVLPGAGGARASPS